MTCCVCQSIKDPSSLTLFGHTITIHQVALAQLKGYCIKHIISLQSSTQKELATRIV